jgi:hypothetical protein
MFWFIVAVVFFVLWLTKQSKSSDNSDHNQDYAQGYWDGYRAHKLEIETGDAVPPPAETKTLNVKVNDHINVATEVHRERLDGTVISAPIAQDTSKVLAEQKIKHDLQNINTTLYVASFLLVAAVALFIGSAFPESVRFAGVWLITITFYVAGLILHDKVEKLRPAAIAFVGTGLALLPFTGVAMHNLILVSATTSWFVTSIIGVIAFSFAAIHLKNQIIAYFAIALMISSVTASCATIEAGLIWYFVVLIIFGSLMTFVSKIKPTWVPKCFASPIQQADHWIIPLTLIASLFSFTFLSVHEYWIITLASTVYYGAVAASSPIGRDMALFVTRLLGSIAALLITYDITESWEAVGLVMSMVGILQVAISFVFLPNIKTEENNNEFWLWGGFLLQLFAPIFVQDSSSWAIIMSWQWSTMLIMSFVISYLLKRAGISVFGTIALLTLPIIIGLNVIQPAIELQWISLIFVIFAAIVLAIRSIPKLVINMPSIHPFLVINFCLFLFESLFFTMDVQAGWGLTIWLFATLLVYGLMYLERQPWLSIVANFMILISVLRFTPPEVEQHWIALVFIVLSAIVLAIRFMTKFVDKHPSFQPFLIINTCMFIFEGLAYTTGIEIGWKFSIWLIAALLLYAIVYVERQPVFTLLANTIFVVTVIWFVELMKISSLWQPMIVTWIVFAIFYSVYWSLVLYSKMEYAVYFWWSAVLITGFISFMALSNETLTVAAGITLVGVAAALLIEGLSYRHYIYVDVGAIIATIGLQRIVDIKVIDVNWLVYTHWWAIIIVGLALFYYAVDQKESAKLRAILALLFVSVFTGMAALGVGIGDEGNTGYRLIFLIEHILMLVAGLIASWKMLTVWGAVGVTLAVLWMLAGYTSILLALAALALIGAAIYALVRQSKS